MNVIELTPEQCKLALAYLVGWLSLEEDEKIIGAIKRAEEYAINLTKGRK